MGRASRSKQGRAASAEAPRVTERVDEAFVIFVARAYDAQGRPVSERTLSADQGQPVKIFRAQVPDVWAWIDAQLGAGAAPPPAPPKDDADA